MNWLNYHHLQYFWVVSREGSVARASEVLHVTPATISIQLRDLEKSLGVDLFRKSGRGLALTESDAAIGSKGDFHSGLIANAVKHFHSRNSWVFGPRGHSIA